MLKPVSRTPKVCWPTARARWIRLGTVTELRYWQAALPTLLRGDFIFTLVLWVAVFSVAAAVVALPNVPLTVRYSAGLVAVAWWTIVSLFFHAVRLAQASERAARGQPIVSWLS